MITHGANVDQLTNLGSTLTRQIDSISQVMSTVDGVLNATAWTGPARDQFVEDWNGSFKQALGKLNEAFGLAGRDCIAMSDELRRVLGARG
jgi:peroxiredoxin